MIARIIAITIGYIIGFELGIRLQEFVDKKKRVKREKEFRERLKKHTLNS